MKVTVRGEWPGRLLLRSGWSKAVARPWNEDIPDASLRLVRGAPAFLVGCTGYLLERGAAGVASPPLPWAATRPWRHAGFQPYLALDLFERSLSDHLPDPPHHIEPAADQPWQELLEVDRGAFPPLWRLDELGLQEAVDATPQASLLLAPVEAARLAGFAIVGISGATAYLQRVAVRPEEQGRGYGRALLRASLLWARRRGASTILLNTQPGNAAAAALYRSEGFVRFDPGLHVLRRGEGNGDPQRDVEIPSSSEPEAPA